MGRSDSETDRTSVPVHSVRIGGIPGTHEVHFADAGETLTFSHRALSREVFARGAIRAAQFIAGKAPGRYSMEDLVEQAHA